MKKWFYPNGWINYDKKFFGQTKSFLASRAEKEEMDPGPHWKVFELIKVKVCHDDVEVCKGYDLTSASDQDMEQIKKEQIFKCIAEKKGLPPIPEKISEFNEMDDCDFNRFQSSVDLIKSIKIPKKNYEDVSRCHDSTHRSRSRSPIHCSRYNSAAHNSRSPSKSPTLHNSRSSYRQYNTKDNSQSKKANWKRSPHRYQASRSISSSSESPTKSSSKQSSNVTNRLKESFNEKGNFTDASQNISYPIETGKFQKGVMKFMAEVKIFMNDMNTFMEKQINNRGESNREELKQLLDIDEFLQFEENLVEPVFRTKIIEHLKQVGGGGSTVKTQFEE
ncbi:uncharacterized protein LOC136076346 [Hydra vulgaris]|uniref:Uncharacterized protein LOC136076346 n=1 Tax=Hydra vulgaris TaxID=6087 RepID=A0ABM4BAE4_HYDVU